MTLEELHIWTVGHSTRTIEEFVHLLKANEIDVLADVRRFPGSRRNPQFNQPAFGLSLQTAGIAYLAFPELGGRRRAQPDSPNTAWRNESFRGYADYMATEAFKTGIGRLLEVAERRRLVIMCAEAVWWRCHRSIIADYLKADGVEVIHIMADGKNITHPYTSAARIIDGHLSYTAPVQPALQFD